MKKINVSSVALAGLVLLGSCSMNRVAEKATSDITEKKWQLIELEGKPVADRVNGKMPYLELRKEDKRYSASGGCNGIGGTYEWTKNGGVKFSRGMSTMMACPDMTAERGLNNMFEKADRYRLENDTLIFSQGNGAAIAKFKLAGEEVSADTAALQGTWELNYIQDPNGKRFDELYAERKPTITFDAGLGNVFGNSSCNNFSGKVTVKEQTIQFSPLAMTKMACQGDGESVFMGALGKVDTFDVQENTLTFIAGDTAVMRFQRK